MISYCIACYRPVYSRLLIDELTNKTTAAYEILVWLNVEDPEFENFLEDRKSGGCPLRVVGRTPENIGMTAYPSLFDAAKFDMVAQIDDDVVRVSPCIAERAADIFERFPKISMLTADVWQDEFTNGARPPMESYREFSLEYGLYDGPIDGWFAIYRKSAIARCGSLKSGRYYPLGCVIKNRLASIGEKGLLCTRLKVFHALGAAYACYFGMLDSEIQKYAELGLRQLADLYCRQKAEIPPREELARRVRLIEENLRQLP
jgi:hypothetical protein